MSNTRKKKNTLGKIIAIFIALLFALSSIASTIYVLMNN